MTPSTMAVEAREALRLAEAEPQVATVMAASIVDRARAARDFTAAAIAQRAWGLALRHRGDVDSAIGHLREAVRMARRAGSRELAGEARITLSFALVEGGHPGRALAEIDNAVRDLTGVAAARALTQRGTILLGLGRYTEAIEVYRAALPTLRDAGDMLWLYRLLSNRGLAHTYRNELGPAEADLRESVRLATTLALPLSLGFALANVAFVLATRGDVPAALDYFARAEERIRSHDAQVGALLLDRSHLLLSVRLVAEARETAEQALVEFQKEHREIKVPEVRLLLAHAAHLDGDDDHALRHARQAVREFARDRRPEWATLARLAVVRSQYAGSRPVRISMSRVEGIVTELSSAGWPVQLMEARLLAARMWLGRSQPGPARQHLREISRARRSGPATIRARAWYAESLLRSSSGDRAGATSAIRAGLRVLDRYRAVLGATDLRARVAGHRTDLVDLGLRIALDLRQPRRVLEWAERGRASHLLQPPVRPPQDDALAEPLATLRATVAAVHRAQIDRQDATRVNRLLAQQVALEHRVRDLARQRRGEPAARPTEPVPSTVLATALGDLALLEFVQLDGWLYVVSMVESRARLRPLGPVRTVSDLVDRIPFALHRLNLADLDADGRDAATMLLRHAVKRLDEALFADLPEIGDRALVIVPTGPLQCLPWSLLPSIMGRPVTVSPSATIWQHALQRPDPPAAAVTVSVSAGPALPGAAEEARAVAAIHRTTPLIHPHATVDALMAQLNNAHIAHIAAHGRVMLDNPLFSDLRLSDGPLMVYDLERLEQVPHTVVLAACDSARSVVCAGDELLGLSATFLSLGTKQLIASVLPVLDAETAPLMVAFHRLLAAGHPPAVALSTVQQHLVADPATMVASAGFICVGAGFDGLPDSDRGA